MDPFALRQFDTTKKQPLSIDFDTQEFEDIINAQYDPVNLKDGYAPFCKHVFVENFTTIISPYVEITEANQHLIKCDYEARTEKELPVLARWFPIAEAVTKKAKYLDIILYSKAQIHLENEAMGNVDPNKDIDYDYGIISIKAQDVDYELPMNPITMMRNALGKEEGGSGVKLERENYMQSCEFWKKYCLIK